MAGGGCWAGFELCEVPGWESSPDALRLSGLRLDLRYRSCLTGEEAYFLACQRYIELNPVRAGMVAHPAEYRWSSYRANAQGEADPVLTPHDLYEALGADAGARTAAGGGTGRDWRWRGRAASRG